MHYGHNKNQCTSFTSQYIKNNSVHRTKCVVLNENSVENKTLSHLGKQKDILERERVCVCVVI